jgi:hypothetical protein
VLAGAAGYHGTDDTATAPAALRGPLVAGTGLHRLDSLARLRSLVAFYVAEHNAKIPHSAFQGQTPDEVYFGTGNHVPGILAANRVDARAASLAANRAARCRVCTA